MGGFDGEHVVGDSGDGSLDVIEAAVSEHWDERRRGEYELSANSTIIDDQYILFLWWFS
ncbi:MAG: hypothetical protein JWN34_2815 [Bryobacterales bacterium]|nr:hypothetical protein [Bryobacterales bacterium]